MRFSCKTCGATFQTATGSGPKAAFACPACGGEMAASADVVDLNADRLPTRRYDLQELRARLEVEREESARARGTPRTAEQVWFAAVQGRQVGPLTSAGLQGLRARGQLSAATLVWREGWPSWVAAEVVGELRGVLGLPEDKPGQSFPVQPAAQPAPAAAEPAERVVAPQEALAQLGPQGAPAPVAAPAPALSLPFFVSPEPVALQVAPASAAAPVAATAPDAEAHTAPPGGPATSPAPGLGDGAPDATDPGGPPSGMVPRGPGGRGLPSIPEATEHRHWGEKTVPDAPLPVLARGDITIPDAMLPVFDDPPPLPSSASPPALPQAAEAMEEHPAALASRALEAGPVRPPLELKLVPIQRSTPAQAAAPRPEAADQAQATGANSADPAETGPALRSGRGKARSNPPPRGATPVKMLDLSGPPQPLPHPSPPTSRDAWFAPVADGKEVNKRPVALAVAIVVVVLALAMILRAR